MSIQEEGQEIVSRAEQYVRTKAWAYSDKGEELILLSCPLCGNNNGKFYIKKGGEKDGLWNCFVCGEKGNLHQLQTKFGDKDENVSSIQQWGAATAKRDPLPSADYCHKSLINDEQALDYLVADRGFKMEVIERFKLGIANAWFPELQKESKALVIPYIYKGKTVFAKYRTLPPEQKAFASPSGFEAPLFNEEVIVAGMSEVVIVEGEADALSCISNGIEFVVGVPGANVQKAMWLKKLDNAAPGNIYLLYDNDKVGQDNARKMASKIGIEKCRNILLPDFTTADDKPGKDINEWFRAGHTTDDFEILKQQARPFDVAGVVSVGDALAELEAEIEQRGSLAALYDTPWPSVNKKLGGVEPGDLVVILAPGKIGKSSWALNWLDYLSQQGHAGFFYCLEMTPKRMVRKWVSYVTKTPDSPELARNNPELMREAIRQAKPIAAERRGDILFGYTVGLRTKEVFDTIRQAVRRYGVKCVVFDNLQLLSRSISNTAQELSVLSREFKSLSMELAAQGVFIILIVQPKKIMDGQMAREGDALGTSSVEKDCDSMIILHRKKVGSADEDDLNGYMDTESSFEPQMYGKVGLNRYGPGGFFTLWMEGDKSLIREFEFNEVPTFAQGIQEEGAGAPKPNGPQPEFVEA